MMEISPSTLRFAYMHLIFVLLGETPVKRDYSTNVTLVATTPLEKIKQRFRNRLTQINATNNSPDANYSFLND